MKMYFIIITAVNMFEPGEGEELCFDKLVKLTNFAFRVRYNSKSEHIKNQCGEDNI